MRAVFALLGPHPGPDQSEDSHLLPLSRALIPIPSPGPSPSLPLPEGEGGEPSRADARSSSLGGEPMRTFARTGSLGERAKGEGGRPSSPSLLPQGEPSPLALSR